MSLPAVPQVLVGWEQWELVCFEWMSAYSSLRGFSRPFSCLWITIREWPALCMLSPDSAVKSGSFTNLVWENTWTMLSFQLFSFVTSFWIQYDFINTSLGLLVKSHLIANECKINAIIKATCIYFQLFDFMQQNKSGLQKVPNNIGITINMADSNQALQILNLNNYSILKIKVLYRHWWFHEEPLVFMEHFHCTKCSLLWKRDVSIKGVTWRC